MFTGLVEDCGALGRLTAQGSGARLLVTTKLGGKDDPFVMGESIAVDGVCLTVVAIHDGAFEADASKETLDRTTLGHLAVGARVNLERAMKLGGRMGGHIVSGHVDGVGALAARTPESGTVKMSFSFPPRLAAFIAEKGSIAINGISLTVNGVTAAGQPGAFDVTVIPHTLSVTSLGALSPGSAVNLEVDLVARYVARMHEVGTSPGPNRDEEWLARLTRAGYV